MVLHAGPISCIQRHFFQAPGRMIGWRLTKYVHCCICCWIGCCRPTSLQAECIRLDRWWKSPIRCHLGIRNVNFAFIFWLAIFYTVNLYRKRFKTHILGKVIKNWFDLTCQRVKPRRCLGSTFIFKPLDSYSTSFLLYLLNCFVF